MNFSHTQTPHWGKLRKLHFWRWGVTLDWDEHRFILTIADRKRRSSGGSE